MITGITLNVNVSTTKTPVEGDTASHGLLTRDVSGPLSLTYIRVQVSTQEKITEYRKTQRTSRWRSTVCTNGTYDFEAGGTAGATLEARMDGRARRGVA